MVKANPIKSIEAPKNFTDVLYLTNQEQIPAEINRLFKEKRLSFSKLAIDKFAQIVPHLELIGTAIIDTEGLDVSGQQKLARIIESLELKNVGTILLSKHIESPVKSFVLAGPAVKSFVLTAAAESVSISQLWSRISANLAYRKQSSLPVTKPAVAQRPNQKIYDNKLAEQLNTTGALVDNLAEQLRMAGMVQRDFLPTQLPNCRQAQWATIFRPAEWVSGDIYDIVRIDEQHIGFYVADAVGHAMPAALLTIFIKQAMVMRETIDNSYRIFTPAEIIKNLNQRMTGQKLSGYQFATCCYCMLNIKTLQLTYARAGHPYPVLLRQQKEPQQLEVRGPLLGIFDQAEFLQQTVQLQRGDKILLYSDGAEPFIGSFDDLTGFHFTEAFYEIKDLPITRMCEQLSSILQNREIATPEADDITAIILQIL